MAALANRFDTIGRLTFAACQCGKLLAGVEVAGSYCEHGYTQVKKIRTDLDFPATILDALGRSLDTGRFTE